MLSIYGRASANSGLLIAILFAYTIGTTTAATRTVFAVFADFPNGPYCIGSDP